MALKFFCILRHVEGTEFSNSSPIALQSFSLIIQSLVTAKTCQHRHSRTGVCVFKCLFINDPKLSSIKQQSLIPVHSYMTQQVGHLAHVQLAGLFKMRVFELGMVFH